MDTYTRSTDSEILQHQLSVVGTVQTGRLQWGDSERLMVRIAQHEPQRWEPHYNIGVIRAITGDSAGARLALEKLRLLNPAMEEALAVQYIRTPQGAVGAPGGRVNRGAAASSSASSGQRALAELPKLTTNHIADVSTPGRLPENRFVVGEDIVELPAGQWIAASRREYQATATVAGAVSAAHSTELKLPALAGSVFTMERGALGAIVTFATTNGPIYASVYFQSEPCETGNAFMRDPRGYEQEPDTCAYAQRLESPGDSENEQVREVHALATRMGVKIPRRWYELHYATFRHASQFRIATVLWPASSLAGDMVAADWLKVLAYGVLHNPHHMIQQPVAIPPVGR